MNGLMANVSQLGALGVLQTMGWQQQALQQQQNYQQLLAQLFSRPRGSVKPTWHEARSAFWQSRMQNMPENHNCELVLWEENGEIKSVVRPKRHKI